MKETIELIARAENNSVQPLLKLIEEIRPQKLTRLDQAEAKVNLLLFILKENPSLAFFLKKYLEKIITSRNQILLYTDLGIQPSSGFFKEFFKKISYLLLPPLHDDNNLVDIINQTFHNKNDHSWISYVDINIWNELFQKLNLTQVCRLPNTHPISKQLANSIIILSHRIAAIGLEPELVKNFPEIEKFESPFLSQNREINAFMEKVYQRTETLEATDSDYKHVKVILNQCNDFIQTVRKNKDKYGTSLGLTYLLKRLSQNIERIQILLQLHVKTEEKLEFYQEIKLFELLIKAENEKINLNEYFQSNISLLAYQITEHAGKIGEKYITTSPTEYFKLFFSALKGGAIVGVAVISKMLLYFLKVSPFSEAALFSANYALAFIVMQFTNSTLATKQPALTATKLATVLGDSLAFQTKTAQLKELAELIINIFRSQFIAFIGNVLLAFPITYFFHYSYLKITGNYFIPLYKAHQLIRELNPLESPIIIYGAITGVYLFLVGLISGYYDNFNIYNKMSERIRVHPFLNKIFSKKIINSIANYIDKNTGNFAGNIFLGLFLGSTATIGFILGLPLDSLHVTFASGTFGIALFEMKHLLSTSQIALTVSGILIIGILNFGVSFGLALIVATKSRNVSLSQGKTLIQLLAKKFISNPLQFFIPIGNSEKSKF